MTKMKYGFLALALWMAVAVQAQNKTLQINKKNYNEQGLVIDRKGKLYTGTAKEVLKTSLFKNEGYLIGQVSKGNITGFWEYYNNDELQGYHCYLSNGDTTFSFSKSGRLDWVEMYDDAGKTRKELKVDANGDIEAMHIFKYAQDGNFSNIFEYERFPGNYFDVTIADYDYQSQAVVDFFKNEAGEEEIIMRDFDKDHELVKIISKDHQVKQLFLLGDILEQPEDADYRLEKGFSVSFTELKDRQNFKLSLLANKEVIFDVIIKSGDIQVIDKRLNNESTMLIYDQEQGYLPAEHKEAKTNIESIEGKIDAFLKAKK